MGNILSDGQANDHRALIYGANNRLAEVFRGSHPVAATYRYNYKGQRVSKTVNGKTTHFHFNANKQLIAETTVQGAANGHTAEPVRDYLYGAGMRLAVTNYAPQKPVAIHYVLNDHLGTPALLVDNNQHIVWRMKATPFGDEVASNNLQPLRFPGQYADGETGYSYNYFRDYDPSLGRYLQSDPIGLMGGVNTYGYVGGNPVLRIDPKGLLQVDAYTARRYPAASAYINRMTVYRQSEYSAFATYGGASRISVDMAFIGGTGPTVSSASIGGYGEFTPYSGSHELRVDHSLLRSYENGDKGAALLLETTVKHELTHYFDDQNGIDHSLEEGDQFEKAVYGEVLDAASARRLETQCR